MPLFAVTILSLSAFAAGNTSSNIFDKLNGTKDFNTSLLPDLTTNDSISRITDLALCPDGSIFFGGVIEALDADSNVQSLTQDEPGDRLGARDMFLGKLSANGSIAWTKRFGSRGADDLRALTVDAKHNVYVGGSIGRAMGDQDSGGILMKYSTNGTRDWIRNLGDGTAGDTIDALEMNDDSSEVIVAGTIESQSNLHTDDTRVGVSAVMVVRVASKDGTRRRIGVGKLFDNETGVVGAGLTVDIMNGSGSCFVVGSTRAISGATKMYNSAIYSFKYPALSGISKREMLTQTEDVLGKSALSNNRQSVYAVGTNYVSMYAEVDISVKRFEANGLKEGWSATIGSKPFTSQASVEEGGASEYGRDVGVDKFGNMYVLGEASGAMQNTSIQEMLNNKRVVLLVYAPDGSRVYTVQSELTEATGGMRMIVKDGKVVVGGWVLDQESLTERIWLSGVEIPQEVYRQNGEEIEVDQNEDEGHGGTENGQDREEDEDTGSGSGALNIGLIAGAAGAAVAAVVVGVGVAVVLARKRNATAAEVSRG